MTALRPKLGRFIRAERNTAFAPQLARCVPGCVETPAPIFCPTHWPLVSPATRREIVARFRILRGKRMPQRLNELLRLAVSQVAERSK